MKTSRSDIIAALRNKTVAKGCTAAEEAAAAAMADRLEKTIVLGGTLDLTELVARVAGVDLEDFIAHSARKRASYRKSRND